MGRAATSLSGGLTRSRRLRRTLAAAAVGVGTIPVALALASQTTAGRARPAPTTDPAGDAAPSADLASANLVQHPDGIAVQVTTWGSLTRSDLADRRRRLCVELSPSRIRSVDVCVRPGRSTSRPLLVSHGRDVARAQPIAGRVALVDPHTIRISFAPQDAGLPVGVLGWSVTSTVACSSNRATSGSSCSDRLPDLGVIPARVRASLPTGCRAPAGRYYTSGPRSRHAVALTFDDGPWSDTPTVLSLLERAHARATFFMIGQQVAGHGRVLRRLLAGGSAIANHTWSHANVAAGGPPATWQLARTNAAIERTVGFAPCLVRAPYGAVGRGLFATAGRLGMATVEWDVDPRDWSRPGAAAIYNRVIGSVRNGSIVLMHDGGGDRSQTLAALPRIISTLQRRGYDLVTVPELIGAATTYRLAR